MPAPVRSGEERLPNVLADPVVLIHPRSLKLMWWRSLEVAAAADVTWNLLIDTRQWPQWGPTVTGVRLDHEGHLLRPESTGAVRTPLGLWLRFEVEDWVDHGVRTRSWSWRVAGVPATGHRVTELGQGRSRLSMGVPTWAPAYLLAVEVGVRRVRALAERQAGEA